MSAKIQNTVSTTSLSTCSKQELAYNEISKEIEFKATVSFIIESALIKYHLLNEYLHLNKEEMHL